MILYTSYEVPFDVAEKLVVEECPRSVLLAALHEMMYALFTYGGLLAGFVGRNPQHLRPKLRYVTSLVTIMDSLILRRRGEVLAYDADVARKSDWVLSSTAFEACGFLVRCEHISVGASHFSEGGWGPLCASRLELDVAANARLASLFLASAV